MQVLSEAFKHSKVVLQILFGILVSAVCLAVSFWIIWTEVRHTERSQAQIAREHLELQKSLANTLSEVRIDLDEMKKIADQIQREEVQRLSGDTDFIRQWVQARDEQSQRSSDLSNRVENIDARLGRVLDILNASAHAPQLPDK
jgi:hypothetical protein